MLEQTLAIIRNTFFESIRQPVVFILLIVATILLIIANLTSTFTMEDDQKMLIDVGLATVFLFGALLAAFIATNVLTREIENKTVLTVVSKPVGRPLFVIGKFLGVAGAILIASLYMAFVFMLIEHHGTIQTVRDPVHLPVLVFGIGAGVLAFVVAIWCNYMYGRVFASTFICVATPLAALAYLLSLFFDPKFSTENVEFTKAFNLNLWYAVVTLIAANIVLTAIALALSTRLSQIMTILATIAVFLLGLLSNWLFGGLMFGRMERIWRERARNQGLIETVQETRVVHYVGGESIENTIDVERLIQPPDPASPPLELGDFAEGAEVIVWWMGKIGHSVFPNFQVLWLSEAVTQGHVIPPQHVAQSLGYAALTIVAAIALAIILFQRREVG